MGVGRHGKVGDKREASRCMLVPYSSAAHYRAERIDTIQTKTENLTRGYYI